MFMNYEEKFLRILEISDNLTTGPFGGQATEYSERGFNFNSQTADLDVVFDPATQDWSVRCEYEDDFNIDGHREVVAEHGNGWNELVSYLFYDSDLTWFLNAKATDVNALRECATVAEDATPDKFNVIDTIGDSADDAREYTQAEMHDFCQELIDIEEESSEPDQYAKRPKLGYDLKSITAVLNHFGYEVKPVSKKTVTEDAESQEDVFNRIFKPGNKLVAAKDIYYGDLKDLFWEEPEIQKFKELGFIKDDKCIFPRGTRFTAVSDKGPSGWPVALLNKTGEEFDFAIDGEPDETFIVLSEDVITEEADGSTEPGDPNNIDNEHDAAAFIESINWEPLNKFVSEIIGAEVNFKASNLRPARGYSGAARYYVDVADDRNFADQCGVMSPVYREVFVDCFNAALCKDKETGKAYFWCTPAFRFSMMSGGSNGINIARAEYADGKWIRMAKDWNE